MKLTDWERQWRGAGVVAFVLVIVAFVFYGSQPKLDASAAELVSFFQGDRTRILIATVIFLFSFLELLWFGAALSTVLRDAGKGGWAAAATASSAAMGAILFVRMTVRAALAFSIAGTAAPGVTTAFSDLGFVLTVVLSFPAAMFVMSGAFGLWRAQIISSRFFTVGVAAVVLALLGGTTWASSGFWAPDGAYSSFSQLVLFAWTAVISGVLVRRYSRASAPAAVAIPAA
jgi:hypothetical protein